MGLPTVRNFRLAKALHPEIVAESVETIVQQEMISRNGCSYEQGYLFSKPIDANQVIEFIECWAGARH